MMGTKIRSFAPLPRDVSLEELVPDDHFYRRLHEMLDDETIIVPGHGKLMHRKDILFHVRYIEELSKQVGNAIERGMSLEEAKEEVLMEDYSSYSMYEFIHFGVNVPTMHGELSGGSS